MSSEKAVELRSLASERGRRSAEEGSRLLVTIATASLGVFFIALSREIKPHLTQPQQWSAIVSVLAMGVASACGIGSWWADAKVHIHWALALTLKAEGKKVGVHYERRARWQAREKWIKRVFFAAFAAGITAAIVFLILRILSKPDSLETIGKNWYC